MVWTTQLPLSCILGYHEQKLTLTCACSSYMYVHVPWWMCCLISPQVALWHIDRLKAAQSWIYMYLLDQSATFLLDSSQNSIHHWTWTTGKKKNVTLSLQVEIHILFTKCTYIHVHTHTHTHTHTIQEDEEEFPPKDSSIPDDCIPVPRVCWNGMLPSGLNRMLPLTLWLCIQYLGKLTLHWQMYMFTRF